MKIELQDDVRQWVDNVGFDNILDILADYAEECAFLPNQAKACTTAFVLASDRIRKCAAEVGEELIKSR